MPRPSSPHPTPFELELLKSFWEAELPQAVREIRESLLHRDGEAPAHTSLITTLNTMVKKGFLVRESEGKAHRFSPAVTRDSISGGILSDVLDRVFDGSPQALMLNLLKNDGVSAEEHAALHRLIESSRKKP